MAVSEYVAALLRERAAVAAYVGTDTLPGHGAEARIEHITEQLREAGYREDEARQTPPQGRRGRPQSRT
jgi:hypothetical protein